MGTVRADDPNLTVRLDEGDIGDYCSPLRVVLDTRLSISSDAKLLLDDAETLVITSTEARGTREDLQNVDIESVHEEAGRLDLHEVMKLLAARDINEVMVESGSTLSGALLRARLVDELVIYMAPHFMGDNAKGLLHLPGLEKMDQRIMLRIKNIHQVGNDVRITAEPEQV
jgi:diaminohydroxyphosphoribosylaminopyrimidine deaminase/5-amino-6-(5-phosphoribosylamino)uracil reductase